MSFGLSLPAVCVCGGGRSCDRGRSYAVAFAFVPHQVPHALTQDTLKAERYVAGWFWMIFDDSRRHVLFKNSLFNAVSSTESEQVVRDRQTPRTPSRSVNKRGPSVRRVGRLPSSVAIAKIVVRDDAIGFAGAIKAWILHFVWPHGRRHPPVLRRAIPLRPMLGQDGP